jgi:hypothetical protein
MNLINRKCKNHKCTVTMRLSENCKDEYCSDFCKFEDNPKLYPINKMTKERIQFNLIGRKWGR